MTVQRTLLLLIILAIATTGCAQSAPPVASDTKTASPRLAELYAYNAASPLLFPAAVLDSLLAAEQQLPTAQRIGLWARRFLADSTHVYLFGLEPGGYVAEGRLVDDDNLDCIALVYRVTELARAHDAVDAVTVALDTRFAGAPRDSLIADDGKVDYDRPEHLDYSLDMVRSGHWGEDVTNWLRGAVRDAHGSKRFAKGSFFLVEKAKLDPSELREGDLVWFVLDPAHPAARALRDQDGLVIGHAGVLIVEQGQPWVVHAASSALPGRYEGGRVVTLPLTEYLERVERFAGVIVTRFRAR
jgi:hypothetical protein